MFGVNLMNALCKYATTSSRLCSYKLTNQLCSNSGNSRLFCCNSNNDIHSDGYSGDDLTKTHSLLAPREAFATQRRYEFVGFGKNFGRRFDKYDKEDGKREMDPEVPLRFYRLSWGPWLRTYGARNIELYKKSARLKAKYKRHIFCNAQQSYLLDQMTTKKFVKRKFFVDDIYEPYHEREEFLYSRRKPLPASIVHEES